MTQERNDDWFKDKFDTFDLEQGIRQGGFKLRYYKVK